jgi:hypothetical protein
MELVWNVTAHICEFDPIWALVDNLQIGGCCVHPHGGCVGVGNDVGGYFLRLVASSLVEEKRAAATSSLPCHPLCASVNGMGGSFTPNTTGSHSDFEHSGECSPR